jgi:hypothetical protein
MGVIDLNPLVRESAIADRRTRGEASRRFLGWSGNIEGEMGGVAGVLDPERLF